MTKPTEIRDQDKAIEIGKIIEQLAKDLKTLPAADHEQAKADAADKIIFRMKRDEQDMPAAYGVQFEEEAPDQKIIVLPDPEMMEASRDAAKTAEQAGNANYDLQPIYRIMVAKGFTKEAGADDAKLAAIVRAAASPQPPAKDYNATEFFYFRIGEYAINECK